MQEAGRSSAKGMNMKLSELIHYVGDEHIEIQWLHESSVVGETGPDGSTVSFATKAGKVVSMSDIEPEFAGVVLWIPMNRLPEKMQYIVT